tara:strand:- start:496 stop:912 length:417 start_codon:yes stop_codon:yes gene_type:complete
MMFVMRGGEPCFGTWWSQRTLSNNKDNDMGLNQIITLVGLIISIVAVFFAELAAYSGLLLVIFGLTSGFVSPIADLTGRMAYTVAAVAIPVVANSLDVIPGIGMHLNAIIDNIAIMIAGMVIANFLLAVKDSILPSSS